MALSLRSPYADCEYNLGNLYLKTGQMLEAEQRLRNAASLGRTLAWGNLVLLLEEMGRCSHCYFGLLNLCFYLPFLRDEEAHDAALKAVDTFPDNADMHFQLANSHGKRVRFHQTVFITSMLSSIGLVRVSLLKGKESTSLPSKLPPSQRPFIIATLACFTIGS